MTNDNKINYGSNRKGAENIDKHIKCRKEVTHAFDQSGIMDRTFAGAIDKSIDNSIHCECMSNTFQIIDGRMKSLKE